MMRVREYGGYVKSKREKKEEETDREFFSRF
jgi:hypothetical protein